MEKLKIKKEFAEDILSGVKKFEIRKKQLPLNTWIEMIEPTTNEVSGYIKLGTREQMLDSQVFTRNSDTGLEYILSYTDEFCFCDDHNDYSLIRIDKKHYEFYSSYFDGNDDLYFHEISAFSKTKPEGE